MEIFLGWIALSVACGIFADNRGRSGVLWFFIGFLASPLISALFLLALPKCEAKGKFNVMRRCLHCRESIRRDAAICSNCGSKDPFEIA